MSIDGWQVRDLIEVSQYRIIYCKTIAMYPKTAGMRAFDTVAPVDQFYKNINSALFSDSLLITGNLLDQKYDNTISLKNWFKPNTKQKDLQIIVDLFKSCGLKEVRDQVFGHQDVGNHNNAFPFSRLQGELNIELIEKLEDIQKRISDLFFSYAKEHEENKYGFINTQEAYNEIQTTMQNAKPTLTNSHVI